MLHEPQDAPRIIVFPPLVPIGTLLLAGLLQWAQPLDLFSRLSPFFCRPMGAALLVIGIGLMASGGRALTRGGTNVLPARPALALIANGAYRWTRNPLYLGGSLALFGCAFLFGLDWLPLLFLASLPILHFGIILPEEAYLERKFGDRYRTYKAKVPRYLGPL